MPQQISVDTSVFGNHECERTKNRNLIQNLANRKVGVYLWYIPCGVNLYNSLRRILGYPPYPNILERKKSKSTRKGY